MFFHNFKYTFKIILKNKNLVFWSIAWPIILATLFNMAFSNFSNSEKLDTINIGVVQNEYYNKNEYLTETLNKLSNKDSEDYLFDITYSNTEDLNNLLEDKKIDGYIECTSDETKIIIKENGINQTVIKYVVDEIKEYETLVSNLVKNEMVIEAQKGKNPDAKMIAQEILKKISENKEYVDNKSNKNINPVMVEFYTLIAMACLYSCLMSTEIVKNYLGNINKKGARVTIAPIGRITLLISGLCTGFVIQMVSMSALLLYTKYCLNVDYGTRTGLVVLLSVIGSIAGLALGVAVGSKTFKSDNARLGVMNATVMLGCFFAGMMGVSTKYIIDTKIPIINKINPSNMITDGFYSLYYYESLQRFFINIISLLIFTVICLTISYFAMRRKRYDSI